MRSSPAKERDLSDAQPPSHLKFSQDMCESPNSRPSPEDFRWDSWRNPIKYKYSSNHAEVSWHRERKECFNSWISCQSWYERNLLQLDQWPLNGRKDFAKNVAIYAFFSGKRHKSCSCETFAKWVHVETWQNPKTYSFYDAEISWNREMNQLLINDLRRGAKISKTTKRISDLWVQWPGKLITFSLGGRNPEMWYVFSLR